MRILIVAPADSIHTASWIGQIDDLNWDLHLFPFSELHPSEFLEGVTLHSLVKRPLVRKQAGLRRKGVWWPIPRGAQRLVRVLERSANGHLERSARLARLIERIRPDVVHSLGMQYGAYLTLEAKKRSGRGQFPPWIYSSWGSDMYYFANRTAHLARIRAVLEACDYLVTDCARDVNLACELGFRGEHLGTFPVGGGLAIDHLREFRVAGPPAQRRTIAVKGRQHDEGVTSWAGQALVVLGALERLAESLRGYEIVVFMASPSVLTAVDRLRHQGLSIRVLPHSPPETMFALMGRSRIAIGINTSDGTPHSMLEAMALGAFPVQSDTVSTREWIQSGNNGILVSPDNPNAVVDAVRRALDDDGLVDAAAPYNQRLIADRVDAALVRPQVIEMYERVARDSHPQVPARPRKMVG